MNITRAIRANASSHPDAAAFIVPGDAVISYRALDRLIDRFARRALASGVSPGQTVGLAISGPDEALSLTLSLALARVGIATAEPGLPARHLAACFIQPGQTPPGGVRCIGFDASWLGDTDEAEPDPMPIHQDGNAILRVFSTSGTTGLARHCPVSHAAMAARIVGKGFPIVSPHWPTVLICAMGLGGAAGLRACLTALDAGGTLVFTNQAGLMNAVLRHKVTVLALSPRTLQEVLARIPVGLPPLPSLRALRVSGSQLPGKLAHTAATRLCPNVVTTFGSTETGNICAGRYDAYGAVPLAVGVILPDMEAEAVDQTHRPQSPGTEGLLRFRGPGTVAGYLDDDDAASAVFRDGWFYSGDRGAVTTERLLVVTGRTGDFINSGGVKVNPREIEAVLLSQPNVDQAIAFGVPDADGLAQIWAAIVADAPVTTADLIRLCEMSLGSRAPKFILRMPDLPRNANGKVVTRELIEFAARYYRRTQAPT